MILEEIPLVAGFTDQTSDIVLNNQPYTIRVQWNTRFEYWALSLYEREGDPLLVGIKMVQNYPLIQRFQKVNVVGDLYFLHRGGKTYRPGFDDIGTNTYGLFYYDPEAESSLPVPLLPDGL